MEPGGGSLKGDRAFSCSRAYPAECSFPPPQPRGEPERRTRAESGQHLDGFLHRLPEVPNRGARRLSESCARSRLESGALGDPGVEVARVVVVQPFDEVQADGEDQAYDGRGLAARGGSAPRREREILRQIKAPGPRNTGSISGFWQRRAGGKDPLSSRYDFRHGLLGERAGGRRRREQGLRNQTRAYEQ